ncbi:btk-binding protein-related [Anaeramoeba flamelloides]|uniref:Btk-binding protein-related n=1 Tax=Anaeramoeba flamelloides TaxID=1746091 RepID=A0AAV7ZKW3_9EUKA|nr:btk-binding protein-related [Anaeramoeba flamelloides]
MNLQNIYVCGYLDKEETEFLLNGKSNLPNWTLLNTVNQKGAKIIRYGFHIEFTNILLCRSDDTLEFSNMVRKTKNFKKIFKIPNEKIKNIEACHGIYLILTKSGKVYSLAQFEENDYDDEIDIEIPFEDLEKSTFDEIRHVSFFEENDLNVQSIIMVPKANYFLCKDGKLYASGQNNYYGSCEIGETIESQTPILIKENVIKMFGSKGASNFFFIQERKETQKKDKINLTSNNKYQLFAKGSNYFKSLGIDFDEEESEKPIEIDLFYTELNNEKSRISLNVLDIVDLQSSQNHTFFITKEGGIFSCGNAATNGIGKVAKYFTQIPKLLNHKCVQISKFNEISLVLTQNNEIFGWGFKETNRPINKYTKKEWETPQKIELPNLASFDNLKFDTSFNFCILYNAEKKNCLKTDLKRLFNYLQNKTIGDVNDQSIINFGESNKAIKVNKLFVELRTGLTIEKIGKIILNKKDINYGDLKIFFKYLYNNQINNENEKILEKVFNSLNLTFPPKNNEKKFENDMLALYNDKDSKDFTILVQKNERGENENENENKNENEELAKQYEKIHVHKFILIARSGLFRELFEFTANENEKNIIKIKDYSGKSKDSIEILIKYFYTGKIELTADYDTQLIIEELKNSVDYYQLNKNSNLINQLLSLQNKK